MAEEPDGHRFVQVGARAHILGIGLQQLGPRAVYVGSPKKGGGAANHSNANELQKQNESFIMRWIPLWTLLKH